MTAIPRFTATSPAKAGEVAGFLFLLTGIVLFLSLEQWAIAEVLFVLWLICLMIFVVRRIIQRVKSSPGVNQPPFEMIWLPLGAATGIIATILLILGQLDIFPRWALTIGKPMMEQGFLLCVVFGIGSFLIPRLMGTYGSLPVKKHSEEFCDRPQHEHLRVHASLTFNLFLFILFLASFVFEGQKWYFLAYGLRALVTTVIFSRTRVIPGPPKTGDFYIRLIWISSWMITIGLWGAALWNDYRIVWLHVAFIGGFSLMTFAVASMVIMSHAGEGHRLQKPLWIFWMIGLGLAAVVFQRAAVVIFPDRYFQLLGVAAVIWMAVGLSWLIFILPYIFKIPKEDEFAKLHDQAVSRVKM